MPIAKHNVTGLGISLSGSDASKTRPSADNEGHRFRPHLGHDSTTQVTLRSTRGMRGLVGAESGASMVEFEPSGSGFRPGQVITPGAVSPRMNTNPTALSSLERHPTLFTKEASPARNAAELKNILGDALSGRLNSNATVLPPPNAFPPGRKRAMSAPSSPAFVSLEQAKSKARVEVDLQLDSATCVEGGYLKGKILVVIRKAGKNDGPLYLGGGKVRVVGFESIPQNDTRHTFYHCGAPITAITPFAHLIYSSGPDQEGYSRAREGDHSLPFAMRLPSKLDNASGAKGVYQSRTNGSYVRYIAMVSLRIKNSRTGSRSIAHFFRQVEVYPSYNPAQTLASTPTPLYATAAKSLFLGGSGKVKLTASLHRAIWVAGQRCYVKIFVANDTEKKKVRTLELSLIRSETIFRPVPELDAISPNGSKTIQDQDACQTSTISKVVAQTKLEMGEKGHTGYATAKGWWTGVDPGDLFEFTHYILIPPNALSIPRSRLLEVEYCLKISLGAGPLSSDVSVQLPIRIINFLSLDPPPSFIPDQKPSQSHLSVPRIGHYKRRSLSVGDIQEMRGNFSNPSTMAPAMMALIGSDGTYRGDPFTSKLGKLEIRNLTPPEVRVAREQEEITATCGDGFEVGERFPEENALSETDDGNVDHIQSGLHNNNETLQGHGHHLREGQFGFSTIRPQRPDETTWLSDEEVQELVDSYDECDTNVHCDRDVYVGGDLVGRQLGQGRVYPSSQRQPLHIGASYYDKPNTSLSTSRQNSTITASTMGTSRATSKAGTMSSSSSSTGISANSTEGGGRVAASLPKSNPCYDIAQIRIPHRRLGVISPTRGSKYPPPNEAMRDNLPQAPGTAPIRPYNGSKIPSRMVGAVGTQNKSARHGMQSAPKSVDEVINTSASVDVGRTHPNVSLQSKSEDRKVMSGRLGPETRIREQRQPEASSDSGVDIPPTVSALLRAPIGTLSRDGLPRSSQTGGGGISGKNLQSNPGLETVEGLGTTSNETLKMRQHLVSVPTTISHSAPSRMLSYQKLPPSGVEEDVNKIQQHNFNGDQAKITSIPSSVRARIAMIEERHRTNEPQVKPLVSQRSRPISGSSSATGFMQHGYREIRQVPH